MGGFVTHAEQGYANATMIVEMQQDYTEVLANLATATETDREAFNVLTHWNDKEVGRKKCRNSRAETEYRRKKSVCTPSSNKSYRILLDARIQSKIWP